MKFRWVERGDQSRAGCFNEKWFLCWKLVFFANAFLGSTKFERYFYRYLNFVLLVLNLKRMVKNLKSRKQKHVKLKFLKKVLNSLTFSFT